MTRYIFCKELSMALLFKLSLFKETNLTQIEATFVPLNLGHGRNGKNFQPKEHMNINGKCVDH
jgi:hypothetical protein